MIKPAPSRATIRENDMENVFVLMTLAAANAIIEKRPVTWVKYSTGKSVK